MGGKSSKSSPSSSSPSSPSKAAFGVDISSDLINNLKDLHGGSPVSGDDLGNDVDTDTKAMTIEQWRVKDSQRNAELDVYVKDIETKYKVSSDDANDRIAAIEYKLSLSPVFGQDMPCSDVQEKLTKKLNENDMEAVKTIARELNLCMKEDLKGRKATL
mmetsp:Transcript_16468/g.32782  ORF Transcript_16468/g.32782 Transcript_16468/m.32782 type:complete len:159 (-) Transcript_16468:41-517(-)